jgi:hypothetical protein
MTDLATFLADRAPAPIKGPVALLLAEDEVELETTLRHHLAQGFAEVWLLAPAGVETPTALAPRVTRISHDVYADHALQNAVNQAMDALDGAWLYAGYNAEYLFYPFCETRSFRDMVTFHTEERRDAMLTHVIDLYAADLGRHPSAVSLEEAHLDRSGYYALDRKDPESGARKDRQMDFYGGLRWRFEEHVPAARRRIDRIAIFRAQRGLRMRPDFTFSEEEYNTYACPWHHNLTAAVCSFRTAKALCRNPGSKFDIRSFYWHNSTRFEWTSQQLMVLGLMEPGQWF